MREGGAGSLSQIVAQPDRIRTGTEKELLRELNALGPVFPKKLNAVLKPAGREDHRVRAKVPHLTAAQFPGLDSSHATARRREGGHLRIPRKRDPGVRDTFTVDGRYQSQAAPSRFVKPRDAVTSRNTDLVEDDAEFRQPVVDFRARVSDVVADPFRIHVFAPSDEVLVRKLHAVAHPQGMMAGTVDNVDAAFGHHGVAAENGGHIQNGHRRAAAGRFEGGSET